ncbi:cytochrome p450 family 4 [Holotrichia oblita]|uniref:Cytochrome p450 family 4 n=1 Tax=Holotrichia oblita TaxID=644536 RepID=A0ACB9TC07_HOLOL|nr:cytochrome p450 family 4 [Holotrichia oblita]
MYLAVALISLAIWYLISWYKWKKRVLDHIEEMPGMLRIPIIGTDYIFIGVGRTELFEHLCKYIRKYGTEIFRTWNGNIPCVHLLKPEYLELIMTSSVHLSKGQQYDLLHPWLGQGLLTGKETTMGVNVNAMSDKDNEYIKAIYDMSEIIAWKMLRPYIPEFVFNLLPKGRRFNKALDVLHGFSRNVISSRKKLLQSRSTGNFNDIDNLIGSKKRLSLLDMLLEASKDGKILNDNDIREEVDTFMFEGHDTTTASISWTLLLLGNHPEIQEKLFKEVRQVLRNNQVPSVSDLPELKYLECVIKESLRLYPSVPLVIRNIEEDVQIDKYKIPRGTHLILHIHGVHVCPDYYEDPFRFDPDRFLPENCVGRHPYAYIPFSAGPRSCIEKLPGDPRYPIIGTEYIFIGVPREDIAISEFKLRWCQFSELFNAVIANVDKYAPIFRTWNGSSPEVHLTKPEHLELIMNNSIHITKGQQYANLYPWLGEGLLTSSGSKWYQHRKLITPAFHFKILENFMNVFVEKAEMLLCILDGKADGNVHNIYPDITHCALDIICQTAMGVNVNAMLNKDNEYIKSVYDVSAVFLWRAVRPYVPEFFFNHLLPVGRKFKEDLKVLHRFSNRVIADRRRLLIKGKEQNGCLGNLKEEDIKGNEETFVVSGFERAFDEIRNVLHDKQTPTSITELHELKYLECIIKESLRLYPSVPFITRHIKQEIQLDEYRIPADVQAILHIYGVHRNPDHYFNPDQFDPDRFLPKNSINRHPYAYIPFSAGPRNCIGQKFAMYEEKTILASIINSYKVRAVETMQSVKISTDIILRPANGVLVKLEKREI